jgi:hypothetical protein
MPDIMETQTLLLMAGSAGAGAALAAIGAWLWLARIKTALQRQLDTAEAARVAAVERSTQARQQVSHLRRALADLQGQQAQPQVAQSTQAQQASLAQQAAAQEDRQRRDQLGRMLSEAPTVVMPRRAMPVHGFADTQPL